MNIEYHQIGNATIYRGDAMHVLGQLDLQVDALITDPPYSSGGMVRSDRMQAPSAKYVQQGPAQAQRHNADFSGDNRDSRSWAFWVTCWMTQALARVRPGGYAMVFTDWRQLPSLTDAFQAGGFVWRGIVPWDKGAGARAPHKNYFKHQCEYVIWGTHGPLAARFGSDGEGPYPGLITERVDHRKKLHMTAKPVELMRELVQAVPQGGVVLDPFMGSASTGVAALQGGYKFIGIEKDGHYFNVAAERLKALVAEEPTGLF